MYGYLDENNQVIRISFEEYLRSPRSLHHVGNTTIGKLTVSTVFLHIEHCGGMWFETMVMFEDESGSVGFASDDPADIYGYQERYRTYEEAIAGHERVCQMARAKILPGVEQHGG